MDDNLAEGFSARCLDNLYIIIDSQKDKPISNEHIQVLREPIDQSLIYHFSPFGALAWLLIITILALIASALPARSATRVSVRESLVYQ